AVVALTFLVIWELTDEHPIVDLSLFKLRNFRFGTIAMAAAYMSFFSMTVLFPLWLQTVMGYTPTWAGVATSPVGIFALILSPIVGRNLQRIDLRIVTSLAYVVFAITAYWFSTFTLDTSLSLVFLPRLLQGIAVACFFVPINQIILSGIQPTRLAAASGLSNFFRTLSGSMGTALVVTIWDHRTQMHAVRMAESFTQTGTATQDYVSQVTQLGGSTSGAYAQIQGVIQAQSAMFATSEVFWAISIVFIALITLIWLTRPPFGVAGGGGGGH
ncbi:MAG: MFS transporter, partial [Burkholderiales bacterium]|nr:MFS transporter [Burkholderiales bacterium]